MPETLTGAAAAVAEIPPDEARSVRIDWERADEVLGALMEVFEHDGFPYNQDSVRVPQDPRHMPETLPLGGKEHAMFLWCSCYYMRGGIKSVDAFRLLSRVYDDRPDLFDAEAAAVADPVAVGDLLQSHGLGLQHAQIGRFWVENAQRLRDRYEGDPREIFRDVSSYKESLDLIQNRGKGQGFLGFQEKMVSMITYFLMDQELIEPYVFPLPVDVHVMRVSIATEMLKFDGYAEDENVLSQQALDTARELFYRYALDHNINPLRLSDAVWLLSNALCGKQPGNITIEPEGRDKRNGRSTVLIPLEVNVDDPRQQTAYDKTCESCPVQEYCEWNVPGSIYYILGELRRRGHRLRFPRGTLFTIADMAKDCSTKHRIKKSPTSTGLQTLMSSVKCKANILSRPAP